MTSHIPKNRVSAAEVYPYSGDILEPVSQPWACLSSRLQDNTGVRQTEEYRVMPLLVAMMRTGDRSLSRARFRKEKHSMSNM